MQLLKRRLENGILLDMRMGDKGIDRRPRGRAPTVQFLVLDSLLDKV
jgi:hypothetical protein